VTDAYLEYSELQKVVLVTIVFKKNNILSLNLFLSPSLKKNNEQPEMQLNPDHIYIDGALFNSTGFFDAGLAPLVLRDIPVSFASAVLVSCATDFVYIDQNAVLPAGLYKFIDPLEALERFHVPPKSANSLSTPVSREQTQLLDIARSFCWFNLQYLSDSCVSASFFETVRFLSPRIYAYNTGTMYAWCSDWTLYNRRFSVPVVYIDANYDVVCHDPIFPVPVADGHRISASCWDNRASCAVLHHAIASGSFSSVPYIVYATFSDGCERGMHTFARWFLGGRIPHASEYFIVLRARVSPTHCVGRGVFKFVDDPLDMDMEPDKGTGQQCDENLPHYPESLINTHGAYLYGKAGVNNVSRIAIPVECHNNVTTIDWRDLGATFAKLMCAVRWSAMYLTKRKVVGRVWKDQ
jgi:hypothetical protein